MRKRFGRKRFGLLVFLFVGAIGLFLCAWHARFFPFAKSPYVRIPVQFTTASHLPYAEIEIEEVKYRVKIDLGSGSQCCLCRQVLDRISKRFYGIYQWVDVKGNLYESNTYIIPRLYLGACRLSNLTVEEESLEFVSKGSLIWNGSGGSRLQEGIETEGRLGWELLQGLYPFFDLKNSVFYITRGVKSLKSLKKEGYLVENLMEAPLELTPFGCVIVMDTDLGKRRFLLDTGASCGIIKPSAIEHQEREGAVDYVSGRKDMMFSKFMIGSYDYGKTRMYLYEFDSKFENIDGILGVDFFKKNIVFIDCDEKKLWIAPV